MAKRMTLMLTVVGVILGIVGFIKYRQIQAAVAQGASFQPPPEAVTTIIGKEAAWPSTFGVIGTAEAVNGVTVSADLPGIVASISFTSGRSVHEGDVLVKLDSRQEQAQLAAAEAKRDLDRLSLERSRGLLKEKVLSQSDYDAASAAFDQSQASAGEVRATLERKTIRAPFSGVLGIRRVNLGQYLNSGDPVVSLQSIDPIYVGFSVPQQELGKVRPGGEIRIATEGTPSIEMRGRITAIDAIVDASTRNMRIQASFANPAGRLRAGMFVKAQIILGAETTLVPIPSSAVNYAPYGDSVFIVEDIKSPEGKIYRGVRQQFVKLGSARGDQVAVLSGVKAGEEIVSSGGFKLRNGAAVHVNNEVRPSNDPAPRPEDN